ncbi:hypothetical protein H2201_001560 [Coniosporium apollinis]|uniref:Spindle assembly checkpoint component MAD1 n=1 Tax=Coniosporium apollinis TaxID=61459 RepID=A0ABQ9P0J0_9PEZI|nr:hypothetical protein H2201_001560 [Coniosporium apollinis]
MTSFSPRKESGKEKPAPIESNPALWHGLATLAISAGFRTAKALELQEQDPDQDLAIQFLRKARPYNDEIGDYVRAIVSVLKQIRKSTSAAAPPDAADNTYLSLDRRCGRPFEDDYLRDRRNVFLPNIYNRAPSGCLTSLQVKCQLFYEFFGDLQQSEDFFPSQAEASANGDTDMIDAPPDLRATSCEESDCVHAAQRMELERTLYDVRQRIRDVETGSEASKAALFTLTNDKAFVEEEKRALQDERGELQKQIRELRESQQNSEQRTQRQERERELEQEQQVWLQEQLRDVKQQAQEQLVQLEERLQEVNQQAQDHLRTAEILQKELQNAQQQVEQIKTAKEDLEQDSRRAAESASDHRRSLEKELNDIRQEAEQSKLAKDDLERKYLVAESGVRQWELREQQLEEGLRKVQQNMQELAQSLSQANEAEEKTKLDLHSAQKDILAKDGRLVELKDEVQKLQKRLEEAQISTLRPCISFTEVKSAKDVFDRLDELMIERVKEEIQFKKPQEAVIVYAVKYYHGGLSCVQVTLQEEQRDLESLQGLIAFYEREHRTLMLAMSSQMDWLPRNSPQAFYDACKRSGYCVFGTQEDRDLQFRSERRNLKIQRQRSLEFVSEKRKRDLVFYLIQRWILKEN